MYKDATEKPNCRPDVWVYLACTLFCLGFYKEAEEAANKGTIEGFQSPCLFKFTVEMSISLSVVSSPCFIFSLAAPKSPLQNRLMFHLAHKVFLNFVGKHNFWLCVVLLHSINSLVSSSTSSPRPQTRLFTVCSITKFSQKLQYLFSLWEQKSLSLYLDAYIQ